MFFFSYVSRLPNREKLNETPTTFSSHYAPIELFGKYTFPSLHPPTSDAIFIVYLFYHYLIKVCLDYRQNNFRQMFLMTNNKFEIWLLSPAVGGASGWLGKISYLTTSRPFFAPHGQRRGTEQRKGAALGVHVPVRSRIMERAEDNSPSIKCEKNKIYISSNLVPCWGFDSRSRQPSRNISKPWARMALMAPRFHENRMIDQS